MYVQIQGQHTTFRTQMLHTHTKRKLYLRISFEISPSYIFEYVCSSEMLMLDVIVSVCFKGPF